MGRLPDKPLSRGVPGGDVPPHPRGEQLGEEATRRAVRLAALLRDDGAYGVAALTDHLSRDELVALAVAAAAMLPADVNPSQRLAWLERRPHEWPDDVVEHEASRAFRGATDHVARVGMIEQERRRREQLRAAGLTAVPA